MATALVWTSSSELGSLVGDKFTAASPDSCNGTFPIDADPFFWGESAEEVVLLPSTVEVVSMVFEYDDASRDGLGG